MTVTLGIDLGTQSLKTVAYDAESRRVLASGAASLALEQRDDGSAEQLALWWLAALAEACAQMEPTARRAVRALSVSGQQHGFVPVDAEGEVLAPIKLWCDTSTSSQCAEIMAAVGGADACISAAGNPILPGYTASKVVWFRKSQPELYARMRHIMLPHDYLNFVLTGEVCMEAGDASGTGFFDVRERCWSSPLLGAIDPDRDLTGLLPAVRTGNAPIGVLRKDIAGTLGLRAGIPVAVGGGDNMMGAIGTANVRPGALTISLGTSGTVYAYSDKPVVDPKGQIAAFCSSTGGWLPLLCTMNCTVSTELMRDLLASDLSEFESQVGSAPPGSGGVLTVPFFNGERTPDLPAGKGAVLGLDGRNATPANLLRSAMEGATLALRFGIDELTALGIKARDIVLIGGGAQSASWRQLVADVFGLPVRIPEQDEGAAFGAALQALELVAPQTLPELAAEHFSAKPALGCEPNDQNVGLYADVYSEYQRVVGAVSSLYVS